MGRFFAALVAAAAAVKLGAASEYTCEAPPGTTPGGITKVEGGGAEWMAPVVIQEGIESNPGLRAYRLFNMPDYLLGGLYISSATWPGRVPGRYQLKIEYTAPARIFIWTEEGSNDGGLKALLDGNDNEGFELVDQGDSPPFERRDTNPAKTDVLRLYSKLFITGNTIFVGPLQGITVAGLMSNCDIVSTTATTTTRTTTTLVTLTETTTSSTMTSSTSTYTGTSSTRTTSTSTTVTSTTVTTSTTTSTTTTLHSVLQIDAVATFKFSSSPGRRLQGGAKCNNLLTHFNKKVDPDSADQESVDVAFASAVADTMVVVESQQVFIVAASAQGQDIAVDFQIFVPFEPAYSAGIGMLYWNQTRSTLEQAIRDRVLRTYAASECPSMEVSLGDPTLKLTWSDLFYDNLRTTTNEMPSELEEGITLKAASGGLWALLGLSLCCIGGLALWWVGLLKKCFAGLLEWQGRQFFAKLGRKPTLDLEGLPDDEGMFDLPQTLEQSDSGNIKLKSIADIQRQKTQEAKRLKAKSQGRLMDDETSPTATAAVGSDRQLRVGSSMAFRKKPTESQGRLPLPATFGAKGVVKTEDLQSEATTTNLPPEDPFCLSIEDQDLAVQQTDTARL